MDVRIEPCSRADLDLLLAADPPPHLAHHHQERFGLQADGSGIYLLAWQDDRNVGRATVYTNSKYELVRLHHPHTAEINALEAVPQGRGIGTALIRAAEKVAAHHGHRAMGLGVEPANPAARRLYERLGYQLWDHGQVIDEWTERPDDGVQIAHADPCDYLIKSIGSPTTIEPTRTP